MLIILVKREKSFPRQKIFALDSVITSSDSVLHSDIR